MKFAMLTNIISPHKIPLARELSRIVGENEFAYIALRGLTEERRNLGWKDACDHAWVKFAEEIKFAETADVLLTDIRDFNLIERRISRGMKTIYESERWFKPIRKFGIYWPGWLRLLLPRYFKLARRLATLFRENNLFFYFPIGVWAKKDALLICRLFRVPVEKTARKMCLWGYFVDNAVPLSDRDTGGTLKIFWAGRMMRLKRVDTLIKAVKNLFSRGCNISLKIIGTGEQESQLRSLAYGCESYITFEDSMPQAKLRSIMREFDVYVMSSNGEEGWGAIVSEAMSEGIAVVGTYESGASATLIRHGVDGLLYHAGNVKELSESLSRLIDAGYRLSIANEGRRTIMDSWSPSVAATRLINWGEENEETA